MKRQYRGRADAMVKSAEGEQGFWPSYADMMSAVALILFFLMLLSYIQNLITGNNLRSTQEALAETQITLADTQDILSLTLREVKDAEDDLAKITIDLDEAKLLLAQQQDDLAAQDKLLADQKALIGEQEDYPLSDATFPAHANNSARQQAHPLQDRHLQNTLPWM